MADKNRKPYLAVSIDEFRKPGSYQRAREDAVTRMPSRYLSQSLDRESEFEKPYFDADPRRMHIDPNVPDWPVTPRIPTTPPKKREVPDGPGCSHCALAFDPINNCNEDWGEAHAMVWCSNMPGTGDCPDCQMQITAVVGQIVEIAPGSWGREFGSNIGVVDKGPLQYKIYDPKTGGYRWVNASSVDPLGVGGSIGYETRQAYAPSNTMSLKVKVNPLVPNHVLHAEMVDGAGNYCETYLDVDCACDCDDPPNGPFQVDTANSDTITSGKSATVVVLGGCPQYTWSIAGTGWSINPSGASDLMAATVTVNTSVCNAVTSVAVATVTIVDNCGTSKTHKIRHEGGTWTGHGSCVATCTGGASCIDAGNCLFLDTKIYISEDNKWEYGANFNCRTGASSCTWTSGGVPCTEPNPSICDSPTTCATYFGVGPCACTGTPGLCYLGTLTHYIWSC